MKRKLFLIITSLILLFTISSCSSRNSSKQINDNPSSKYIKYDTDDYSVPDPINHSDIEVTFDCNNGFKYLSHLSSDKKVLKPSKEPTKVASTFEGWYSDEALTKKFNFTSTYSQAVTVYAKYETNFEELSNLLYEQTILSNIKVVSTFSNDMSYSSKTEVIGSGVIISASQTGYYALTNYHVICNDKHTTFEKYEIYDCYNNKYIVSDPKNDIYSDINYDLAIIKFNRIDAYGETVKELLNDISFSNFMPKENDTVIAIGNPHKIMNSISYGKYLGNIKYTTTDDLKDKSNINFNVMTHSAKIETGSSGGMVVDSNLRLVGINFACKLSNDKFEYSLSIPLEKVIEFILDYEKKD